MTDTQHVHADPHATRTGTPEPLLLAGAWVKTPNVAAISAPFDGRVVCEVCQGDRALMRTAIDRAETALAEGLPLHLRVAILEAAADRIRERDEELAQILVREAGKPLKAARIEADRAVSTFRFAAAEARRLSGEAVAIDATPHGAGRLGIVLREPVGIVGAISPFNFPLNLVAHKLAPAIAAGCPVILKPAGQTPLSALRLGAILQDSGLPEGWLSILPGPAAELGDVLVDDPRVKLITFTGSPGVGWSLRERCPRKRVALELGNNSPAIVSADADIRDAACRLAANAFSYAGQSCISVQRVYVEQPAYREFLDAFVSATAQLTTGDPADPATDVGPLITRDEAERVRSWIEEAQAQGARLVIGGQIEGSVMTPTVLTDVPHDASISCQEVFGPVVSVNACASVDDGLAQANDSVYGLQAAIFTRSLSSALSAARELRYGGVIVNDAPTFRTDQMPYGGTGESGNTREGPAYTIEQMTEAKLVVVRA